MAKLKKEKATPSRSRSRTPGRPPKTPKDKNSQPKKVQKKGSKKAKVDGKKRGRPNKQEAAEKVKKTLETGQATTNSKIEVRSKKIKTPPKLVPIVGQGNEVNTSGNMDNHDQGWFSRCSIV